MSLEIVNRMLAPLRNRIAHLVARAVVRIVTDGGQLQTLQIDALDGETREGVERMQSYGFTSVPLDGAEAVVLFVGGRRDHGLAVAVDDRRYRPTGLQAGEVCIYNKDGPAVLLKSNRMVATAPEVRLGSDSASNYVALSNLVSTQLTALKNAINGWTPVPMDGGAGSRRPGA